MKFFYVHPEVAGGLGDNSVVDNNVWPPSVSRLHFEFDDWSNEAIITSFPAYIATAEAKNAMLEAGIRGVSFDEVEVSTSELYEQVKEFHPNEEMPDFVWLKISGAPGVDDFGVASDNRLVVSERALDILKKLGIPKAEIEPFDE